MNTSSIPFGQIFILTNPQVGITSKTTHMMGFILSMARQYGQGHILHTLPVDDPKLWDCFICKVKTEDGDQILVSDKDSLVEMLCEFWGLDYDDVCKSIVIPKRNRTVTFGGEKHPMRMSAAKPVPGMKREECGVILQQIQEHTKANELMDIKRSLQNSFHHNLDISVEEIIDLYEEVRKSLKTYHLDIHIERDEAGKISICDINLEDNFGNKYELKQIEDKREKHLEPQLMAVYLTFIMFKDGKKLADVQDADFYETLLKIQAQLPYRFRKPNNETLAFNINSKRSVINKSIWDATHDTYAQEQFAIEGYNGDVFRIAGATDADREKIRKEFGL